MPVTLKKNLFKVRDNPSSNYTTVDVISDGTTNERITQINSARDTALGQIESKKNQAVGSISQVSELQNMISNVFDPAENYNSGDYVIQSTNSVNKLYRFTANHPAGDWTGTDVVEVIIGNDITAEVGDIKSALNNTVNQQISFVQTAADTQSNYYKTFTVLSPEKCYMIRLTVETAGTYTLRFGTSNSSAAMVDTIGTATVQANIPYDFVGYVPSVSTLTTSRLSTATPHTIGIYEVVNIDAIKATIDADKAILNDLASHAMLAHYGTYTGDADNIDENNWCVCIQNDVTNLPGTDTVYLVGTMFSNANHRTGSQIAYSLDTGKSYTRRKASNAWNSWVNYEQDLSSYCPFEGTLPNNTDFNDLDTRSMYITSSDYIYTNLPTDNFVGTVITLPLSAKVTQQYAIELESGDSYYRIKSGKTPTWKEWQRLSPDEPKYVTSGKYVAFGDSVTWGAIWELKDGQDNAKPLYQAGFEYQIPTRIAIACGMENDVVNEGVGGIGYFNRSSEGASVTEKILSYDFTDVELVTVMAGVNDKPITPLGTASDSASSETICGAIKRIIDYFAEYWPAVQLIFIQPTPSGHLSDAWGGRGSLQWSLNEFDEQVSALCHNEHVGYVNWWESNICKQWDLFSGGYSYNATTGNTTGPNYSHMTNESDCAKIGDFIAGKVSALFHGRN